MCRRPRPCCALLKVWTHHRSQGFSDRFVEVLDDPDVQDYLRPLIHELAVAWDGKVITAEGLRRLEFRLRSTSTEAAPGGLSRAVADAPSDILTGTTGGTEFTAARHARSVQLDVRCGGDAAGHAGLVDATA